MSVPTPTCLRHAVAAAVTLAILGLAAVAAAAEGPGEETTSPTTAPPATSAPPPATTAPPPPPAPEPPPPAGAPSEAPPVPPPAVPVPDVTPSPSPDDVFSGRPSAEHDHPEREEHSWFDSSRDFVGRLFFAPAIRLDKFFSDETDLDPERAQSFARLRTHLRLRQDGKPQLGLDLLANIKLPGVNRWLDRTRVVLTGESEANQDALTTDGAVVSPFTSRPRNATNLELRYFAYRGIRSSVDLGAGFLVRIPFGAFSRVRYRLAVPIDDVLVARFSTQGFYRTDMHFGARGSSELDWPFERSSILRLGLASQVAQRRVRGVEYGAELVASHAFSPTFAVALGTDAQGSTLDRVRFQKYRVYTRLRHDVLRRWLFVEVEPEIGWPWTRERGRYQAFAAVLRFEVQFDGVRAVEAAAEPPRPPG